MSDYYFRSALLVLLLSGLAFARAEEPKPGDKPFDHGDDPNVELMQYAKLSQVPEHPPKRSLAPLELKDKIYHGVLLNTDTQEGFDKRYAKYIAAAGKKPSMVGCFAPLWSKGEALPIETILKRLKVIDSLPNVVPFLKLYTGDWKPGGPFLTADDILSGKEDWRWIRIAELSKEFGKPYMLSINHEMNGDWFQYSELYKGKNPAGWTAEKFKLVWRHIHKILRENGAAQVVFAWCPGAVGRKFGKYDSMNSYKAYYPGDDVVDWVGASFYNDVNHYALDNLAATYPNKPIVLAEWGTEPKRGDWYVPKPYPGDAEHLRRTFEFMKRYPNMKAITYFYWGKDVDIERVPEQIEIYRKGIADPVYLNRE
ncbi:MAG: glycoside hydrolase family 26 protein [Candidatus Methylacidiphilales bacterium]|nr:glycosyl hydrolase [Candidatus Methylacidiphilales bacterium]